MNVELERLAVAIGLSAPDHERLRLAFSAACAARVRHLLEDPAVVECLAVLERFLQDRAGRETLDRAAAEAAALANRHRGSNSIDGTAHAAVSATYAVANAVAGNALQAASYAAYATVYAYGGYAVTDPESYRPEYSWQVDTLRAMAATFGA